MNSIERNRFERFTRRKNRTNENNMNELLNALKQTKINVNKPSSHNNGPSQKQSEIEEFMRKYRHSRRVLQPATLKVGRNRSRSRNRKRSIRIRNTGLNIRGAQNNIELLNYVKDTFGLDYTNKVLTRSQVNKIKRIIESDKSKQEKKMDIELALD